MCGIAGFLGSAPDSVIKEQLRLLEHRGPDALAWLEFGPATVGQTRLSVIDLATGDPPITNETGSITAALNGEIYNFRSLREELKRRGHEMRTEGDTEVIAHLAEDLGPIELASRLEGMFAIGIWDDSRRRLTLIRDRVGKKPLYYWAGDGRFVFASEIKAVLAHPAVPRQLDPDAIPAYLTFGYVPTPRTFFDGIVSLPPGSVLTVEPGREPIIERYWAPPISPARDGRDEMSMEDAANGVRERLTAAIERRLIADVPLGAFLSGGIDSSAVVGIMSGLVDRSVRTFTIGFEDTEGFDERDHASKVARRFATDHTEFVVRPDAVDLVESLVWHHDQPFGDSSAIPTYLLSQLTRKHVTVALSGDGGDELFAGYERFSAALLLERYRLLPAPVRRVLRAGVQPLPAGGLRGRVGSAQRFLQRADLGLPDAFASWLSYVDEERHRDLVPEASDWAMADYRSVWSRTEGADLLDRLLHLNLSTYLVDDLLVKMDRMSMAHALEVRSPFLDRELMEFALGLPRRAQVRGFSRKRVLKAALKDLLPRDILHRRKRGFGVPLDRWFREDLASYLDGMLGVPTARVRTYLDGGALDGLIGEHRARSRDHGHALWALLTLEVFLRKEGW